MPFRVLRQFGRVQIVPPKSETDRFNVMFDKGIRPESIPEKSSILSVWTSRRACQESLYNPQQHGILRTTPQYDVWLEHLLSRQPQAVIDPSEEVARLTELLEAKDKKIVEKAIALDKHRQAYKRLQEQ
ncbi:hypothetical protein ACH5RR_037376 [Cinchona calisaya]|uniref:Uncharacterized protein n=1 Tax=Cinchona calisaya TaxID=153742 RepID=A0ABD2Y930_9GENT